MKKSKLAVYIVCALLVLFITKGTNAQKTQGTPPDSLSTKAPQQVPHGSIAGPLIINNGIVRPLENPDLFQYSSLKKSGGTTFSKKIERKSNIEINKSRENKAKNSELKEEMKEEITQVQTEEEFEPSFSSSYTSETKIYVWTDKGGVKHFTNTIDSVPHEYRDQIVENSEE